MAYGRGDWEEEFYVKAREHIWFNAVASKDPIQIKDAKELCLSFTHLLEDGWEFKESV